jgi:hypothetical protein
MPVTTWNATTINGINYLVVDVAQFRIPLDWDPSSNMFIAVSAPTGGLGNFPALVKGDTGPAITLDTVVNLTVLDYTDPTPNSASLTLLGGNDYQFNLTMHAGQPGTSGTATLNPSAYGTPTPGHFLVVDPTNTTFVYQAQMVGDRFVPSVINAAPAGNPAFTLAAVSIPAQNFAWRPQVSGQCVISGTGGGNQQTNLVARLNNASSGNIVGQGFGPSGLNSSGYPTPLSAGPPAGSVTAYDQVVAGATSVVYLRAERQSGTDTFTTSAATTWFEVVVQAIPGTATT